MKYIRDGLYGYIPVSQIEDALLNHPSILRLHKILQNSTLYHTYPFNRGSRFPHSLGTMHVAHQLFKALVTNSRPLDFHDLIVGATKVIDQVEYVRGSIELSNTYLFKMQSENELVEKRDDFFEKNGWLVTEKAIIKKHDLELKENYVKNVLLQGVRLAAIVHDLGHPPYSHVVEFALEGLEKEAKTITLASEKDTGETKPPLSFYQKMENLALDYQAIVDKFAGLNKSLFTKPGRLHEKLGLVLIDHLYSDESYEIMDKYKKTDGFDQFFQISFAICVSLIATEQYGHYTEKTFISGLKQNENLGSLYPLANIISGPVDCDRLDYLLRDATNSGTPDFLSFDQERIINNITLAKLNAQTIVNDQDDTVTLPHSIYIPAFDRRAFSALADFFYTRFRQFRWLISHHNVVRTDHALSRAVLQLSLIAAGLDRNSSIFPDGPIDQEIRDIVSVAKFDRLLEISDPTRSIRYIDDPWLDSCLQTIFLGISHLNTANLSEQGKRLTKYLELFIERNTKLMPAIWKNEDRFRYFADGFKTELGLVKRSTLKGIYSQGLKQIIEESQNETNSFKATNMILKYWWTVSEKPRSPYTVMLPIERSLNHEGRDIQLALKVFFPYEQVLIVQESGKLIPLEEMSTIVPKLGHMAEESLMLYAYDISEIKTNWAADDAVIKLGEDVSNILINSLLEIDTNLKKKKKTDNKHFKLHSAQN